MFVKSFLVDSRGHPVPMQIACHAALHALWRTGRPDGSTFRVQRRLDTTNRADEAASSRWTSFPFAKMFGTQFDGFTMPTIDHVLTTTAIPVV